MKIAVTLCASLGGLTATTVGLVLLDEISRGGTEHSLPPALCWWLAVAWVPALVGLVLLFEKGGPAAAWAFGSCPLGCAILALPNWRIAGASMIACGLLTLAAGLSLISPSAHPEGWAVPHEKPRPLLWLGSAVVLSALVLAGLRVYFAGRTDAREQEAETIIRRIAGIRGIMIEVQAYKAKRSRLEREIKVVNEAHLSFRKLYALRTLDAMAEGNDVWIESVEVTEHRFEITLTAPSPGAAAAFQNRLPGLPEVGNAKIFRRGEASEPGRERYVVTGDLNEDKILVVPEDAGDA